MTALVSYSTGTVSVAVDGTTVTGVGTIWSGTNARPGDILQIGDFQSIISDVTDTAHLEIPPWGGGAQSAVAYKIWHVSPQRFAGAQAMQSVNDLVAALNTSGFFVFVSPSLTTPDPSLGDDGQYAFQPTTGKTWAKVAGVWTFLGIYKGFNLRGAYDNATTYSYGDVQTTSGSSYIYISDTPSAGHAAPNTTYWQLLASIGATGATGAAGSNGTNGTNGAGYGGTSTTSLAIGTGSKAFTTQSGLAYTNGARVRATASSDATKWMEGTATYSGTTLTITVDTTSGSGTIASWNLNVAGQVGASASITSIAASLGADVSLNNTSNYFDGPSVAQGTSGTWFVSATVSVVDTAGAGGFLAKLWDGTTVIAAAADFTAAASQDASITLSGVITNPAGNLRVSVRDYSSSSGKIEANRSNQGNRDSTITAIKIA